MVTQKAGWGGAKRFYQTATIDQTPDGWRVLLDDRPVRAPSGALLLAGPAVAAAVAAEWEAQGEMIDPGAMPTTRALNTAIDRIPAHRDTVADDIAGYGGTDLLCYRAERPQELIDAEAAAWDPLLDWAEAALGARLQISSGVMHALQPETALTALSAAVRAETDLGLVALHDLTTLSGSLIIGLAVRHNRLTPAEGWRASRVDEDHQAELWGRDDEAAADAERGAEAFAQAARLGALDDQDRRAAAANAGSTTTRAAD
ncbi:MAG: ATPase [Neomegalonema sp.]|nr:ATPase [Neomegalonema sp.]